MTDELEAFILEQKSRLTRDKTELGREPFTYQDPSPRYPPVCIHSVVTFQLEFFHRNNDCDDNYDNELDNFYIMVNKFVSYLLLFKLA